MSRTARRQVPRAPEVTRALSHLDTTGVLDKSRKWGQVIGRVAFMSHQEGWDPGHSGGGHRQECGPLLAWWSEHMGSRGGGVGVGPMK